MNKYAITACFFPLALSLASCKESSSSGENALAAALLESVAAPTSTTTVDASSAASWTYLRLSDKSVVSSSDAWDLAFKRFKIATNSGVSGSGSAGACDTTKTDFASVTLADAGCAFLQDTDLLFPVPVSPPCAVGQTEQGGACYLPDKANAAMQDWYNYDGATHAVTSKQQVYVVRSKDGAAYYKLQLLNYASGMITLQVGRLN